MDTHTLPEKMQDEAIKSSLEELKKAKLSPREKMIIMDFFGFKSFESVTQYLNGNIKGAFMVTCFIHKANEIINNRKK